MKRTLKVLLGLVFGLGLSGAAHAASSDTLTVTITPNAFYSVDIDTGNVSLSLGTVALGASTQTVQPATVTVLSTFALTDLKLQGVITASANAWSFDDVTTSSEADKIATWATFTSVARSSAPTQTSDYFSGTQPGQNSSDVVSAASLRLPATTTGTNAQNISITIGATAPQS